MSFQACLDAIEVKTGLTPRQLVKIAETKGFSGEDAKAGDILEWVKADYGLGRGHGMALVHVIRNGRRVRVRRLPASRQALRAGIFVAAVPDPPGHPR